MNGGLFIEIIDVSARELALFACIGFLIGGLDDLAIDILYWIRCRTPPALPPPSSRIEHFALFVPAWDEAKVIDAMLSNLLGRLRHPGLRVYVGTYPNDPATFAAVTRIARSDPRVRLVVNPAPGPTTKAQNLNAMWRALQRDEAAEGWRADALVLHDAEDVVHADELAVFARLLPRYALVQLPVLPLIAADSRWISAHYADEFAEVHVKGLAVRQMLGAGLPLAGVGCAIRRDALDAIAATREGAPFDAASLVEDYELGLTVTALGVRSCFAQVRDEAGAPVCVRSYFPGEMRTAARQKARWMAGIALIGWDRLGWGRAADIADHWMRLRDRRAPIAILLLAAAYLSAALGALSAGLHLVVGARPVEPSPVLATLLAANTALLGWRLVMRAIATGRRYGWREGARSAPRLFVSNFVALAAAWRAIRLYHDDLRGYPVRWDKTDHAFPVPDTI